MKRIDLTGQRFGRLTVIEYSHSEITGKTKKKTRAYWVCRCDCGNEVTKSTHSLKGNCNSCGCYRRDFMLDINDKGTFKGVSKIKWKTLVKKCTDPKDKRYYLYGGRGTTICEEWLDFENFFAWVKERTDNPNYDIVLKDRKGIYEPNNCMLMPKLPKEKKERTYHAHCPVSEKEWEELARGSATMVLEEEELYDYFNKYDPWPYVFPKYACKVCEMSEPTFKRYARKYLIPEIYGKLPSDFFDEKYRKVGNGVLTAKKLPRLE